MATNSGVAPQRNAFIQAPRRGSYPGDLSAIVDSERYCQFQAGVTISNQAVQLKDRAVLPQHRTGHVDGSRRIEDRIHPPLVPEN